MKYTCKRDTLPWWYDIPAELFNFTVATDEGYYPGNYHATVLIKVTLHVHWRPLDEALNAYGEHFKWEVNKENTADKFH